MSDRTQSAGFDVDKIKEIDASITEGKLMLQVLRSLPKSENNDTFISRFEELVSRLEEYKNQGKSSEDTCDVQFQINSLKEKQEKIRRILDQTACEFQNSFPVSTERAGSSHNSAANQVNSSTAELLSQFKNLISSASTADENPSVSVKRNDLTISSGSMEPNSSITQEYKMQDENESKTSKSDTLASLVWLSQFSTQCAKLEDLIEDTKRFQKMVDRLTDITRRAHLSQATGFLIDISSRFDELRKSFDSLRESYRDVQSETEMPEELRNAQLTGLQDFLTTLDRNLESTKECFFTIYHIVKSSIEKGVADGSLRESLSDAEEEPQQTTVIKAVEEAKEQEGQTEKNETYSSEKSETENPQKSGLSDLDQNAALQAQKAYLTALQGKTASEKEEIAKLLRQRDELAARLNKLKTAALAASQPENSASVDEAVPEATETTQNTESPRDNSPGSDLETAMLAHLEAKKRELAQLRAQLELFRKAEERMAALQLDDQTPPEVEIPKSCVIKSGGRSRQSRSHRPSPPPAPSPLKTRFLDSIAQEEPEPQNLTKLTTQPETACLSDNTELLYENMREARIRLEEQRGVSVSGGGVATVLSVNGKAAPSGGAASVATSQDRTTLATWGGSSSTRSNSSSNSVDGPAGDRIASTPQLVNVLTNGLGPDPKTIQSTQLSETLSSCRTLGSNHVHVSTHDSYATVGTDLLDPTSLPQLGRSPSPPRSSLAGISQVATNYISSPQPTDTVNGESPLKAGVNVTTVGASHDSCTLAFRSALNDRVQNLESSVTYLYHTCHNLLLQNLQLHLAIKQLLLHTRPNGTSVTNSFGPFLHSHNMVPSANRLLQQSPVPQSAVPPSDVASTVSSIRAANRFPIPVTDATEMRPLHVGQQLTLHMLMQQQAQKYTELDQILQQFNQQRSVMVGNRASVPPPTASLSSQLVSPAVEGTNFATSFMVHPLYPFDQPGATVLTAPQWPYRTAPTLSSTGLVQTSVAALPADLYAGLRPNPVPTSGLYLPPLPAMIPDSYTTVASPHSSLYVATSRTAPVVHPGTGHSDVINQVWMSPGSTVNGRGPI